MKMSTSPRGQYKNSLIFTQGRKALTLAHGIQVLIRKAGEQGPSAWFVSAFDSECQSLSCFL